MPTPPLTPTGTLHRRLLPALLLAGCSLGLPARATPTTPLQRLAPTPAELAQDLAEQARRLAAADATGLALAGVHNRWGEALRAAGARRLACSDPLVPLLGPDTLPMLAAHTQAVQAARAQRGRLQELVQAGTVRALSDDIQAAELDRLDRRVDEHERAWAELSAWQAQFVAPTLKTCKLDHPLPNTPAP